MHVVDNFWFQNLKEILKDFEIDVFQNNERAIKHSLCCLWQFISTNSTNKVLIIRHSLVASQLKLLCDKVCCDPEVREYVFLEEFLGTLNSLASIDEFKNEIVHASFIGILFKYVIVMEGNVRKNSILLLRTLLNAQNINTVLTPEMELNGIIKNCLTSEIISHILVVPCLSLSNGDYANRYSLMEKRTGLFILQLLSVLSTDVEINRIMFYNQIDYLHVLHRILMQFNFPDFQNYAGLSINSSKTEAKYILKIIAYFLYYNPDSIDHLLTVLQCNQYQELIGCYEYILWIDDKSTTALLGLVRGLMFWRMCLKLTQQDNSSIEAITNLGESIYSIGLGLTLEDIVKMIITPLTLNDSYFEFDGLGCWVMHALFLVLQQHFDLSELLMQCNGFLYTIYKKLTPKIQLALDQDINNSTEVINIEKLHPLLKLLAWMSAQSDAVKISIGESDFFLVMLECYQKTCIIQVPNCLSTATFQKSIWLLIQALSRNIYLHRTLFHKVAKYSHFIKEVWVQTTQIIHNYLATVFAEIMNLQNLFFVDFFLQFTFVDIYIESALKLSDDYQYRKTVIEIISSCISTVSNLILPTSPLRNDLLEWAMDKFINLTNGKMFPLTDIYPALKLCGMCGLVNATYSLICYDEFFFDGPGNLQDQYLLTIISHLINVMPSALGTSMSGDFIMPEIHDKIVLMMWALFRNSLKSKKVISNTVNIHDGEILNFIVSTLESERSPIVKEQALIVLAHIAMNKESREGLCVNEDLMEKIKLFTHSSNSQLKTAAFYAAFNILEQNPQDPYDEILKEIKEKWVDCSVFWEFVLR